MVIMVDVTHAQSENTGIIDRTQIDTCDSFIDGCYFLQRGIDDIRDDWLPSSELNLKKAISSFEQHAREHVGFDSTAYYLGYSYYFLFSVCYRLNRSENIKEYLEKALLYLPNDAIQYRFEMHCYYGNSFFYGDSLSGIEQDYCRAFEEFNKAMAYVDDLDISTDLLPFYKNLYYLRAYLLLDSYYNSSLLDTVTICNEIVEQPDWISCIGEQKLDRCIDDLNHIISINQHDSLKTNIDTLALVLLGQCYYYCADYDKATYYYEESGITPAQLMASLGYERVRCFLDSYFMQGIEDSTHITDDLSDVLFEFWRNNYRLMYMDEGNFNNKQGVMSEIAMNVLIYYYSKGEYAKALDFWFKIKNNFSFDDVLLTYQGLCRFALGDATGTEDFEFAARLNPRNGLSYFSMILSNFNEGIISSPLFSNSNIVLDGHDTSYYSIRGLGLDTSYYSIQGWASYCQKDYATAKDYYLYLSKLDNSSDNLLMVAICYQKMAEEMDDADQIRKDRYNALSETYFCDIIHMEDSTGLYSSTPYAYYYLGDSDNAMRTMEHILQTSFPASIQTAKDSLTCYAIHIKAAEIYANVGKLRLAKQHLKKAFEYCHIPLTLFIAQYASPLLAPIKQFVEKEAYRYLTYKTTESPIHRDTIVCDIPFNKNGNSNTRTISCIINGVQVDNMLFDPGADYVQLPQAVADSIGELYNNYIGWQPTKDANGNPVCQRIVSLDTLKIGDIVLENVQATINEEPGAQLLLGCTVWNNLKVEMPSPVSKGMIRLTYIKESIEIPEQ